MFKLLSRAGLSAALVASLSLSTLTALASPRAQEQQQQLPPPPPPPTQQQRQTQNAKPRQTATTTTSQPTTRTSNRALSTNEDPSLIGRRKINTGIIAGMSGSLQKEIAMGRQIAAEVEKQVKLVDDPVITEYVNRVGQNIVLHSDAKVPFTIKVVDTDEPNAFALPGGFFYVNRGLILMADNESELAGVMAHEIAHVAARHTMEQMAKAQLANYGMLAGMILGIPPILLQAADLGLGLSFLKFTRGAEAEADRLGVQYLYAAGYDPNGMATMFEKLAAQNKKKPGKLARLFTTHPQSAERMEASRSLVARFPEREEYVMSTSEFQRVRARLLRMSNARVTTAGDIAPGTDGTPGRPTLKRRQPAPDDSTSQPSDTNDNKPANNAPPTLRRNGGANPPPPPPSPTP
ncbi:MAG: M48 family metalloprotease [Pyrinomonadaceae bacterium]|nr:M48 family metalloprotease [Pyrinomonadaceae bacterium]